MEKDYYLGIPFDKRPDYRNHIDYDAQTFKCLDGSKEIPLASINDHIRDCDDGSDEFGTAEGPADIPFFCVNKFYIQSLVNRTSVGDGKCDCCDGSDEELNPNWNCESTCAELDKPRHSLLNELQGCYLSGINHRKIMQNIVETNFNKSEKFLKRLQTKIDKRKEEIEKLKEMEDYSPIDESSLILRLWKTLFFIKKDDLSFAQVFFGKDGRIKLLERRIKFWENRITNEKMKYSVIQEQNIPIQYAGLINQTFDFGEYKMIFLNEFFKGKKSIGKFKTFKDDIIEFENGDFCHEINDYSRTTVHLECWNEGKIFEVNEISPCAYDVRVGTQEICTGNDILRLTQMTHEELIDLKNRNGFKPKFS